MREHPFRGSALCDLDATGQLRLPEFIVQILERRCHAGAVLIGMHEVHPCLIAYDPAHIRQVYAETERRRLRDEGVGDSPDRHYARLHRLFGMVDETQLDRAGAVQLSPFMRRLGRMEGSALVLGSGGTFEIWNPQLAAESGDEVLRELVRYWLVEAEPLQVN